MRTAIGWREVCAGAIFWTALAGLPGTTHATPQVVGDGACELHAIDIASFATCENGRVVRPAGAEEAPPPRPVAAPSAAPPRSAASAKSGRKAARISAARRG